MSTDDGTYACEYTIDERMPASYAKHVERDAKESIVRKAVELIGFDQPTVIELSRDSYPDRYAMFGKSIVHRLWFRLIAVRTHRVDMIERPKIEYRTIVREPELPKPLLDRFENWARTKVHYHERRTTTEIYGGMIRIHKEAA